KLRLLSAGVASAYAARCGGKQDSVGGFPSVRCVMVRLAIIAAGWAVLLLASNALAQPKTPEQEKIEALQMEVEKLKGEMERLKAELASIKEQVAGKSSGNPT